MKKLLSLVLVAVLALSVFAACGSEPATNGNDAELTIIKELSKEEYGIGFRKGSDLTAVVNGYIAELVEDGTLTALAEKYNLVLADGAAPETEEATLKDLDYIKANGKIIIGITDYEPMNYKDEEGNWTGFDTEFALAVCEKLGVTAEFVEIDWDGKFLALESKAIDCIWNGMTISEDVLNNTSCSVPYVKNAQVIVATSDKADDLANLSYAVESGSAGAAAAAAEGFANVVEAATQTDAYLEVTSGASDACIIDLTMANAMLNK